MPTLKHEYTDNDSGSYNADPWLVGGFPYGKNRGPQGGTALHKLVGANRDLPQMMKVLYPEVDLEVLGAPTGKDPRVFPGMLSDRSPMYDRAKQNTEVSLRDGVDVKITQAPTEVVGLPGVYEMKVRVTNKSGHRIPTGYPDGRRFWLSVQAKDAANTVVYESGVYDQANAELKTTGMLPFKRSTSAVIDATNPLNNAVQVYERVTGTCANGSGSAIFPDPTTGVPAACTPSPSVLNNFILFDNRIPPKGFDAAQARLSGIKFWNYGANFVPYEETTRYSQAQLDGGYDDVTYRFSAPTGSVLSASVEVQWQTHTREFMEFLRTADNTTVRPQGPPNPLDPNYPNVPNYLANSINGVPLSSYAALDGSPLNENWGGVAYASWLATGKGAPFVVDRDDTVVTAAPAAPALTVRELNSTDPEFIDPVTMAPDSFAAKIEWTNVPDADGYVIWIRYGKSEATSDWDRLAVVGRGVTSHIEHVLGDSSMGSPGKTYGFKVVAYNGKGETASNVFAHTVATGLPAAPTNLTASNAAPGSTGSQVTLNWMDNANNENGFEIWRYGPMSLNGVPIVYNGMPPLTIIGGVAVGAIGTQTGGPAIAGQATTGSNTYIDANGLQPNACYNYQVRSVTVNVDVSTFALAPSMGCTVAATPQVNLAATASATRVTLTWTSNATAAANFRVTRTLPAPAAAPVLLSAAALNYADTTVLPSTTYTYLVEAIDAAGTVLASATTTVTTPAVPLAPTGVTATVNGTEVTVRWTDNANNESGFVIERAPVQNGVVGTYQQIPGVGAFLPPSNGTGLVAAFIDTAPVEAQTAIYRVKAINLVTGDSAYALSNQVTVGLFAPANVSAVATVPPLAANVQVTLSWLGVSQKATSYRVERKIAAGAWTVVPVVPTLVGQQWQLLDSFATAVTARTVQYRVTARSATLSSQAVIGAIAIPARATVPNNLTVSANGQPAGSLRVRFNVPATAVGYEIQRRLGAGAWSTLTVPPAVGTGLVTFIDSGLTSGKTYSYAVRAYNAGGWSNWSGSKSAKAP
jgi:hypothetical protein